jgi:addiction module HigA family antidote
MNKPNQFDPDYAVPPGRTLQETIDTLGMTQKELALRTGRPLKTINEIIKGVAAITAETALQLEKVTGVPAGFWNNLEANYRERLARLQDKQRLDEQTGWLKHFSYAKMAAMGLVKPTPDKIEKVENLLRYFGVATFKQWEATYSRLQGAAREQDGLSSTLGDLSAWLRAGEILAQRVDCQPYDATRFQSALTRIRTLTCDPPAQVWPEVVRLCADAGVAVVLVPELPKTHVYGFTRWLTSTKALLQLSLRYKTDDLLWFTFFHEAAHILKHGKTDVFLEFRGASDPKEEEANRWSADFLIPPQDWQTFLAQTPEPNRNDIIHFAHEKKIAPSVVLGRLQHREKRIRPHFYNDLKQRLEIHWNGLNE